MRTFTHGWVGLTGVGTKLKTLWLYGYVTGLQVFPNRAEILHVCTQEHMSSSRSTKAWEPLLCLKTETEKQTEQVVANRHYSAKKRNVLRGLHRGRLSCICLVKKLVPKYCTLCDCIYAALERAKPPRRRTDEQFSGAWEGKTFEYVRSLSLTLGAELGGHSDIKTALRACRKLSLVRYPTEKIFPCINGNESLSCLSLSYTSKPAG